MWLLLSVLWAAFCIALMFVGDGSVVLVAFAIAPFVLFLLGYGVPWTAHGFRRKT